MKEAKNIQLKPYCNVVTRHEFVSISEVEAVDRQLSNLILAFGIEMVSAVLARKNRKTKSPAPPIEKVASL